MNKKYITIIAVPLLLIGGLLFGYDEYDYDTVAVLYPTEEGYSSFNSRIKGLMGRDAKREGVVVTEISLDQVNNNLLRRYDGVILIVTSAEARLPQIKSFMDIYIYNEDVLIWVVGDNSSSSVDTISSATTKAESYNIYYSYIPRFLDDI